MTLPTPLLESAVSSLLRITTFARNTRFYASHTMLVPIHAAMF